MRRPLPLLAALLLTAACSDDPTGPRDREPGAPLATWVLSSDSVLRPAAPPAAGSAQARAELEEVLRLQANASPAALEEMRRWDGNPNRPWTEQATHELEKYWVLLPAVRTASPAGSARVMALLHVAIYDALAAAEDARAAYARPAPHRADSRVRRQLRGGDDSSYPSSHAAAAAAAAEVLKYAFPLEEGRRYDEMARRAGEARLVAGDAYRSDVEAGWAIGRAVAERVLAYARRDGSDAAWDGRAPQGAHVWRPTAPRYIDPPFDVMAGGWKTWVIPSGSAYRPGPPPMPGSAEFAAALKELQEMPAKRTREQTDRARYWASDAPSAAWEVFAEEEIGRRGLDGVEAARAHALISVAMYDAFVAAWDAKFHYWLLRPAGADSTLKTVYSTPPFPSYVSGHSTTSAAAAEVFAYLFPDREKHYRELAHEASLSRIWGMVHYRFDCEAGAALGHRVGEEVVEHAREDGFDR